MNNETLLYGLHQRRDMRNRTVLEGIDEVSCGALGSTEPESMKVLVHGDWWGTWVKYL